MATGETFRSWREFEQTERRRVGTFQLSIDELAKDLYIDSMSEKAQEEVAELDFDHF